MFPEAEEQKLSSAALWWHKLTGAENEGDKRKKIPSDDIWEVAYLSPKQERKQAHPHSFNKRK